MSAMSDDWRLRVSLHEQGLVHALTERLDAHEVEYELQASFSDRVIVSADGSELFCYAGSREQLLEAQRLIESLAQERGWRIDFELLRWHPDEQAWKDPSLALPETGSEREAEHAARIARERDEARAQGYPSFEVRVQCATESDCETFAARLRAEGLQVVRRSKFLLVGADDEDSANELAARFHRDAPEGSAVVAEGTLPAIYGGTPLNPYALFGGLGG
jgi:hypothetical protein